MNNTKGSQVTTAVLLHWAGISAILAGLLFIGIQVIHPPDSLSSVNSNAWFIIAIVTLAMSVLSLIGITGIYVSQVSKSGWSDLIGYLLFSLFWLASISFNFIGTFVLPLLTTAAPQFVEGIIGIFGGTQSAVDLGALQNIAPLAGGCICLEGSCLASQLSVLGYCHA